MQGVKMNLCAAGMALVVLPLLFLGVRTDDYAFVSAAQAQGATCTAGQNCCIVAASMEEPKRYIVVCDQPAQNAAAAAALSGYSVVILGPDTFDRCGAWMAAANIPGWEQYRNASVRPTLRHPSRRPGAPPARTAATSARTMNSRRVMRSAMMALLSPVPRISAVGGYTTILFGPVSYEACHAWWNDNIAVGIGQNFLPAPSGAVPFPPGTFAGKGPKPTSACMMGQNCCYVGAKDVLVGPGTASRTDYAIAYDGAVFTGYHNLASTGYRVVFGPVSTEACHGWWNDNIAARGLASPFPPAPAGSVPFPPGTFRQGGAYDRVAGAQAALGNCEFEQAKGAIDALPAGPAHDSIAETYTSAYERETRTNAMWEEARALDAKGRRPDALRLLNQALANTRCSNYRGRIEATIARLGSAAEPPPSPPSPTKPPAPPLPPPSTTTDEQCSKLHDQAVMATVGALGAKAAADLTATASGIPRPSGRAIPQPVPPDYTLALSRYNQVLSLYQQGAALCRQSRFAAEFAKGIQETTQSIHAIGGR